MTSEIRFFSIRIGYNCVKDMGSGMNCLGSLLASLLSLAWFPTGLAGIWGAGARVGA
jgi:hypothetical protein